MNTSKLPLMRRLAVCFAAAIAATAAVAASGASAETVLYRNFTLIDGRGDAPRPNSSMLVADGRIVWVGPAADAESAPASVDLTGKYVIPGLIDTHVHIGNVHDLTQDEKFYTVENVESDLHTYAEYGFTGVAVMGTDKDSIFQVRNAQRVGRAEMTRIFTAGQGIVFSGGYGGVPGVNRPVETAAQAVAEVDSQAAKGADYIKLWLDDELGTMPKMPPEISKAIIDAAHRNGLKAFAHIFYLEDAKRLADQGIDGFVHSVRDTDIDRDLIDTMKRRHIVQVAPTLSREASLFIFGGNAPQFDDPFFQQSVSETALAQLKSEERHRTVSSGPHFGQLPTFFDTAMRNTLSLAEAGIPYGMGTDSGPPARAQGFSGHWEMELMVEAGLTPMQVIRAATGHAAHILGASDIGTLERSKWADFVVLDANPLEDIRNTRTIDAVYIAGRAVDEVVE